MRIIGLRAENIKKLKLVEFEAGPDGVTISGANEQGKTSLLDAIRMALDSRALKEIPEPIRRGQEKGVTLLRLGTPEYDEQGNEVACTPKLKVSRTFTGKGKSYLKVESMDGAVYKSPQAMLDALIGDLSFDPLAFSSMKEKDQLETLLALVNMPIDLNEWAAQRKEVYDERTAVNRRWAELDAQIKGIGISIPNDTPDDEISAASILVEQREAQAVFDSNRARRREATAKDTQITLLFEEQVRTQASIDRVEAELKRLRGCMRDIESRIEKEARLLEDIKAECGRLVDPDMSVFERKITEVELVNSFVRDKKRLSGLKAEQEKARAEAERLTRELAVRDQEREEALKAAKMPVEGLSFDDNGVLYKDIPFKQCSSAERLRVSIAMGMALNPKLRVMFVRDGSLLDTKHLQMIKQMAHDNQFQLWIEMTDDSGKVGLYIEEGEIKNQSASVAEQPNFLEANNG